MHTPFEDAVQLLDELQTLDFRMDKMINLTPMNTYMIEIHHSESILHIRPEGYKTYRLLTTEYPEKMVDQDGAIDAIRNFITEVSCDVSVGLGVEINDNANFFAVSNQELESIVRFFTENKWRGKWRFRNKSLKGTVVVRIKSLKSNAPQEHEFIKDGSPMTKDGMDILRSLMHDPKYTTVFQIAFVKGQVITLYKHKYTCTCTPLCGPVLYMARSSNPFTANSKDIAASTCKGGINHLFIADQQLKATAVWYIENKCPRQGTWCALCYGYPIQKDTYELVAVCSNIKGEGRKVIEQAKTDIQSWQKYKYVVVKPLHNVIGFYEKLGFQVLNGVEPYTMQWVVPTVNAKKRKLEMDTETIGVDSTVLHGKGGISSKETFHQKVATSKLAYYK